MSESVIDVIATCRNLREMIEEQKYTPLEIQHSLGLNSVQSVYKWYSRNNRTIPSLDNLVKLSELLGCTIEDILVLKNEVKNVMEFGSYFQGIDQSFGKQPIEWIPLEYRDDGTVLVVSRVVIDCKKYDEDGKDWQQTWEKSSLRKWLNDSFFKEAFSNEEQKRIKTVRNINLDNDVYGTPGGKDTLDKVFLLSAEDVEKYCTEKSLFCSTACLATKYAKSQGVKVSSNYTCDWWLRTPGLNMYGAPPSAAIVREDGKVFKRGEFLEVPYGVRPAMVLGAKSE